MEDIKDLAEFESVVSSSRTVLRLIGTWPMDFQGKVSFLLRFYFIIPCLWMVIFGNIPQCVRAVQVWGDFTEFLNVLTTSNISIVIGAIKLICLRYNVDALGEIIIHMTQDWREQRSENEEKIMKKYSRLSRFMCRTVIILTEMTICAHFLMALIRSINESKTFNLSGLNSTKRNRPLYMNAAFPYDVNKYPYYQITFILQVFTTFFAAQAIAGSDALFGFLILHICAQLKILTDRIRRLPDQSFQMTGVTFRGEVTQAVERHKHLRNRANVIEKSFSGLFLVHILLSSFVLCLLGFRLVMIFTDSEGIRAFELTFIAYYTLCFMFGLFVDCYVAEILQEESLKLADAVYESLWYNLTPRNVKLLIIIMIRAKRPFQITMGKFSSFSLELFCSLLKSSGGYISMLLAMRDRISSFESGVFTIQ